METVISRLENLEKAVNDIRLYIERRVFDTPMAFDDVMDGLYREISTQERQMDKEPNRNFPGKKFKLPPPEGGGSKRRKKKGKKRRTNRR